MNDELAFAIVNGRGDGLHIKQRDVQIEMQLDLKIADLFSAICCRHERESELKTKLNNKFDFAVYLQKYFMEKKDNAN